jgi:uncharacterized protein YceK
MRFAILLVGAVLVLSGCSTTVTTVRTISPEEYSAQSWIGHTAEDVALAWGERSLVEADGNGGRLLMYTKLWTPLPIAYAGIDPAPSSSSVSVPGIGVVNGAPVPNQGLRETGGGSQTDVVAKFWIDSNRKVYRFWFADEVYKKHLDSPSARPVERYGMKTP